MNKKAPASFYAQSEPKSATLTFEMYIIKHFTISIFKHPSHNTFTEYKIPPTKVNGYE